MRRRWRGVIAREGVETGDHRMFEKGAVTFRDLPRDFAVIFEDGSWGHEKAVIVGAIDSGEVRPNGDVWGEGYLLDDDPWADRYANMLRQQVGRGVSVDVTAGRARYEIVDGDGNVLPDSVGIEVMWDPDFDGYLREVWEMAEVGSLAAARTPAFADAVIELVEEGAAEEPEPVAIAASAARVAAGGWQLDVAGASPVHGQLCRQDWAVFSTVSELFPGDEVRWMPDDGDEAVATVTSVDAEAGTVSLEINGTQAAAEDDDGEDDEASSAATTAAAAQPVRLAAALARARGRSVVTASGTGPRPGAVLRASVAWEGGPPRAHFRRLDLDGPTPLTITDDGEVYGHICAWGQCHSGFLAGNPSDCVTPPSSPSEYRVFRANGQVRCDDGSRVSCGVLTMDTSHAPAGTPGNRPALSTVLAHYENTGLIAAHLCAYDDDHGVQVHGVLAEGLSVPAVRRAMAARPSGDWRDYGEGLDLAGILLVNQPGYPVVEREGGEPYALLASHLAPPQRAQAERELSAGAGCGCPAPAPAAPRGSLFAPTVRRRLALSRLDRRVGYQGASKPQAGVPAR